MQHALVSDRLTVLINSIGAELCSIRSKNNLEYIWSGNKEVWPRHAPVLFPIVGKLKNNSYSFKGNLYTLNQHGFARDLEFDLVEATASACVFELNANAETKKLYPFDFNFKIAYQLKNNSVTCIYEVKNSATASLFFSVGAHPGFKCPLSQDEKFDDYYLEFEKSELEVTTLSEGLRTGKQSLHLKNNRLFLSRSLFDNDALVFENRQINKISLKSSRSSNSIKMTFEGWPYFGIWSKKGSQQFICLEPWFGIADSTHATGRLVEKPGIIKLGSGEVFNCSYSIELD